MSATVVRNAPSVSPLSTASKTKGSSSIASRDDIMHGPDAEEDEAVVVDATAPDGTADGAELADDRSSSLSEPEDDSEEYEQQNGLDNEVDDEQASTQFSAEGDSEAETERIGQTPLKRHKSANSAERTPSKLHRIAKAEDGLSEPLSPLPDGLTAMSSSDTLAITGIKRKRSHTGVSSLTSADSDLGRSPKKHTSVSDTLGPSRGIHTIERLDDQEESTTASPIPAALPTKGRRGRKSKPKGRRANISAEEVEVEPSEENGDVEEDVSDESLEKTEESLQLRKEAQQFYEDVIKQFRAFREKVYNERLKSLTTELNMLSQANCEHPEYLRQVACVDMRLQKQRAEAHAYRTYRMRSIRDRTLGDRAQLHSQYFQYIRQLREDVLDQLGQEWYDIQKERRQSQQESDAAYIYRLPEKRSLQIRQQAKYNREVSLLSGIAKYVGFPAAPEMDGVQGADLDNDLRLMNLSKPVLELSQPAAQPLAAKAAALKTISHNEKLAQDQFFEQNAWARPQGHIPQHGQLGISHTPDWAEPNAYGSAKGLMRNFNSRNQTSSPLSTPLPQRRVPVEQSSAGTLIVNSDGIEPPSSIVAAPPTIDRITRLQHNSEDSPTVLQKQRHAGQSSKLDSSEGPRNVSGTSTIDIAQPREPQRINAFPTPSDSRPLPFDSSHMHGDKLTNSSKRDVYAAVASFRPHDAGNFTAAGASPVAPQALPSTSSTSA